MTDAYHYTSLLGCFFSLWVENYSGIAHSFLLLILL